MHRQPSGGWTENRLVTERRPTSLPEEWGAHALAEDLVECWDAQSFEEEERLYAFGMTVYQYMLAPGPPWTCFQRDEFTPWPQYTSEVPTGTEPNWCAFDVHTYADFLVHYEGGLPPDRVTDILRHTDLFADYMVAVGIIDERRRREWIAEARAIVDQISLFTNRRGRRAQRKIARLTREGRGQRRRKRPRRRRG